MPINKTEIHCCNCTAGKDVGFRVYLKQIRFTKWSITKIKKKKGNKSQERKFVETTCFFLWLTTYLTVNLIENLTLFNNLHISQNKKKQLKKKPTLRTDGNG